MQLKQVLIAGSTFALLAIAGAANAAVYNFNILYSGGGVAALAPGSDDMLASGPVNGDTINYSITANGSGAHWTTIADGSSVSLFGAIGDLLGSDAGGGFDFTVDFRLGGVSQFTQSGSGAQCCADVGPRSLSFPSGMSFDTFSETLLLTSVAGPISFSSLLPSWPGQAPELGASRTYIYTPGGAAPEPTTWALLIGGFGMAGTALRRRRTTVTA